MLDLTPKNLRVDKPEGATRPKVDYLDQDGNVWVSEELPSYFTGYWQASVEGRTRGLAHLARGLGFLGLNYRVEWV